VNGDEALSYFKDLEKQLGEACAMHHKTRLLLLKVAAFAQQHTTREQWLEFYEREIKEEGES
jgi:hypothetical protein